MSAEHARKEISAQEAVNELEESLASAIYKAAEETIDNKVVAMSAGRTPMHKRGAPMWWTRELREQENVIRRTKQAYYTSRNRGDTHEQYEIGAQLGTLEDELARAVATTSRNAQREKGRDVERLFGEDEQAGNRKHAWDTIQDTRKRSRDGAGRAVPFARNRKGKVASNARESAQNWRASWMEVGEYRPNDPVYDKEHRQEIERELERISELEEQRAQRQISSSEWMKDVEDIEEWELDAPEFEDLHGINVGDIDAEEREKYTELNAMWGSEEFGPALAQMKHYKAAGGRGRHSSRVYENGRKRGT